VAPTTASDWIAVARERAADAEAMLPTRSLSAGPVYMAGYAVECSLKAYLHHRGRGFPKHGSGGHDLRNLWSAAGFRLSDLGDSEGEKTFYLEAWSTDLRYETDISTTLSAKELLSGARKLTGYIQSQVRRMRKHR